MRAGPSKGTAHATLAPPAEADAYRHKTITAQAAEVAALREQRGRLTAELERATVAVMPRPWPASGRTA